MKHALNILILICTLNVPLKAQEIDLDQKVSIHFKDITLKEVINELSDQYDILFSYSDSNIPVQDTVDMAIESIRLGDALRIIFHENNINFNIIGKQIVLFPFKSNQSITIRGRVRDQSDGAPIPYANIFLSGTSRGTSSNEDGEFLISVNRLPSELVISHLSYEKNLVYVYDDAEELEVKLNSAPTTLQPITISAKKNTKTAYQLVKKAYGQLLKSRNNIKYGKAFYRQKSSRENDYTEIFELFYDIKYSPNGIENWAVQEGRYAFQTKEEYDIFLYNKNFTLLSRIFSVQQPATDSYIIPVNNEAKKLFDFELKDVIESDERFVAVISYQPKIESEKAMPDGELLIDLDTYQVLKLTGTFLDENLSIISLDDEKSNWANYQLTFEISFIDDPTGELLMDFIRIDHRFDYYYEDEKIGKIVTSSLLSFYEHYSPAKNKKLGGPINFRKSDIDMIDGVGYNPSFWAKNPIVKRTPLEEKVIRDFEKNEAFGLVFLNNQEEIVLLPDKKNSEKAKNVISNFESKQTIDTVERLYLRMNKESYRTDDVLQFSAHVLDRWQLKPFILGSVLFVEILDASNQSVITKKFDISNGVSFGNIDLSALNGTGLYQLKAYTNANNSHVFQKELRIAHSPSQLFKGELPVMYVSDQQTNMDIYSESGNILSNTSVKFVFQASSSEGFPVQTNWQIIDAYENIVKQVNTNSLGIGAFELLQKENSSFKIRAANNSSSWLIPQAENHGFSMKVVKNDSRSLQVELHQRPALPKDVFILSVSGGKVFSYYEKKLNASKTTIDLPLTHLPGGINTLVALDNKGEILSKRSFFVEPDELGIDLQSFAWKSKRKNRVLIKLKISDQNGAPVKANLSATCSSQSRQCQEHCDIRNYLLFGNDPTMSQLNLSLKNDSIRTLIDQFMIANTTVNKENESFSEDQNKLDPPMIDEESILAEINVNSNYSSQAKVIKNRRKKQNRTDENKVYWIPAISADEHGIATIEYKLESKTKSFFINIQGVSHDGQMGYETIEINPNLIQAKRTSEKR